MLGSQSHPIDVESGPAPQAAKISESTEVVTTAGLRLDVCGGVHLPMPPGVSPYQAYPFGLHDLFTLPWGVHIMDNRLKLQSIHCTKKIPNNGSDCCRPCEKLFTHNVLDGIMDRITHGIHEHSTLAFQPIGGLVALIRKKTATVDEMRFAKLSISRQLVTRTQTLDDHKKFLMALGDTKIERVNALIRVGLRRGAGIHSLIQILDRANKSLYKPKDYSEEEMLRGILFLRLGGSHVANLAHRTLGAPGISTLRRNTAISPLNPSVGMPTKAEVRRNIRAVLEDASVHDCYGYVLMIDEIKVEERLRWDPHSNNVLGLYREHTGHIGLEFCSAEDVKAMLRRVLNNECHYATEVTTLIKVLSAA